MKLYEFTEYMETISTFTKDFEEASKYISYELLDNLGEPCNSLVNLLAWTFQDESDWIGYWIYELDCGVKYEDGKVTINDQIVKLLTIEDLYKVLVDNQLATNNESVY